MTEINWMAEPRSRTAWAAGAFAAMLVFAWVDYLTGFELSFAFVYLWPVAAAAWMVGWRSSVALGIATPVVWIFVDRAQHHVWSHPAMLYWNGAFRMGIFITVALLVSELRRVLTRERRMARTDFLTGAMNSREFHDRAAGEISRARRYGHPLTAAYVDLDDFKRVNDELGHSEGDRVLRASAQALREHLRDTDSVARIGGDEFVVLLPETDCEPAQRVIAKLHGALNRQLGARERPVTASMGVVTFRRMPASPDELLRIADTTMYAMKRWGKNRVAYAVWDP
ncbi:MAG TPA: GGDEF domain-containing protein [Gemmatimonadaceae bacterium]|nr:GGDEF domain-containing protein [Gemmatimonadaceae bacterium]